MSNLNIPPPNSGKRPTNVYEWLGLIQKVFKETKGIDWNVPNIMTIKQLGDSIGNDLNFKQTMFDTIKESFQIAYTPQNILKKLKTVDGLGSGLDADFVRGYVPVNKAGDVMSGFLTLHADPEQPLHAATKNYVDSVLEGFIIKMPVRVATTQNITLSGSQEIDGIPVVRGDRVLVKNQTNKVENGIYEVSENAWVRSNDANDIKELKPGSYVFVNEGFKNKDSAWVIVSDIVEVGRTEIEFIQFSGTGQITPGTGLAKDGNVLYITNTGVKAGTHTKVTVDAQGRITGGTILSPSDIPNLDWSKITSGKPTTVQGYGITNAVRTDTNNTINASSLTLESNDSTWLYVRHNNVSSIRLATSANNTSYIQSGLADSKNGKLIFSGINTENLASLDIKVANDNATINSNRILTVKDFGSGNGINADLLDGLHATSFMRTDADTYTNGSLEVRKNSTEAKSALSIIAQNNGDSSISLLRTGSGLRQWRISNSYGKFIISSKTDTDATFIENVAIDTSDRELYVKGAKVWHRNNDGTGSGLDADLLDGQEGSYYRNATNINAGLLNNARLNSNVFIGDNSTYSHDEGSTFNHRRSGFKRISANFARIHYANPSNNGGNSAGIELSNTDTNDAILKYYKANSSGTKVFDYKIWHEGQQGHNSGLDADKLDGKHFNDLNNLFLNASGDTMTGFLTLHADPTNPLHAVTKQYVDTVVQGLDFKASVRCATTANIAQLKGLLTVDGVVLKQMDRVLVKNQTDKRLNGIYNVTAGDWVRSSDANHKSKLNQGAYIFVEEGVINISSGWVLDTMTTGDIGVAEISFIQFSGTGQIIAGTGLGKNGNEIYLKNTGVTPGIYTKLTVDAQGRITTGNTLSASDIPNLDWSKITSGKPTTVQGYGITNAVRTDATSNVTGAVNIYDSALYIKAKVTDHCYIPFYPRNNSNTRGAYIGFGSAGTNDLSIKNEIGSLFLGDNSKPMYLLSNNAISSGEFKIKKSKPRLVLENTVTGSAGLEAGILFKNIETQELLVEHVYVDSECPVPSGNGLRIKSIANGQVGFLQVLGDIFAGSDGTKKVYHTGNFNPASYLPLTGGTLTGGLVVNNTNGITVYNRMILQYNSNGWMYIGSKSEYGDCYTRYKDNGTIEFSVSKSSVVNNGLLYNGKKVWHELNDGSGSGLDADKLDGADSSVAPTNGTIVKRGTDGSVEATTAKMNKIELGGKAEIVFNTTDNSIDFIIK